VAWEVVDQFTSSVLQTPDLRVETVTVQDRVSLILVALSKNCVAKLKQSNAQS